MTNGGNSVASGDRPARKLALATFFAIGLAFAIVNALSELDERARSSQPVETWEPWAWELTSFASFLMLAPFIFRLSQRLQPPRLSWPVAIATHFLLSVPASLAHSAIMIGLRHAIYWVLGEHYGYGAGGELAGILVYEFRKDLISYAVLAALPHVARRLIDARRGQQAAARRRTGSRSATAAGRGGWRRATSNGRRRPAIMSNYSGPSARSSTDGRWRRWLRSWSRTVLHAFIAHASSARRRSPRPNPGRPAISKSI